MNVYFLNSITTDNYHNYKLFKPLNKILIFMHKKTVAIQAYRFREEDIGL